MYRIYTEAKNGTNAAVLNVLNRSFESYTRSFVQGTYKGKQENALVIEVIGADGNTVERVAEELRELLDQDEVLIVYLDEVSQSVKRPVVQAVQHHESFKSHPEFVRAYELEPRQVWCELESGHGAGWHTEKNNCINPQTKPQQLVDLTAWNHLGAGMVAKRIVRNGRPQDSVMFNAGGEYFDVTFDQLRELVRLFRGQLV